MTLSSLEYLPKELYLAARRIRRRLKECEKAFPFSYRLIALHRQRDELYAASREARAAFNRKAVQS